MNSHQYRVTHTTVKVDGADTDHDVYIYLRGSQGEFSCLLDNPGDDRQLEKVETYKFLGDPLDSIEAVGFQLVKVDGQTPQGFAWNCGAVEVENLTTGELVEIANFGWIDRFDQVVWRTV